MKDFLIYHWTNYGKHVHLLGMIIHSIYFCLYIAYANNIYLYRDFSNRVIHCWAMLICLLYPLFYDTLQLFKQGISDYFSDPWNYVDQFHIWIGISNVFIQRFSSNILDPLNTVFMLLVGTLMMIKTFFFLRIFDSMSFLVSMIKQVTLDLRPFLGFVFLIILFFSQLFGIIDWGQFEYNDQSSVRTIQYQPGGPDKEYLLLFKQLKLWYMMLRLSIGDNNYDATTFMN